MFVYSGAFLSKPTPMAVAGGGEVFTPICLCVSLSFLWHDISKTDAARITKLDTQVVQDESWKPVYFGVKRSRSRVTKHCRRGSVHLC